MRPSMDFGSRSILSSSKPPALAPSRHLPASPLRSPISSHRPRGQFLSEVAPEGSLREPLLDPGARESALEARGGPGYSWALSTGRRW